jgi:hypothetical protein
MSTPGPTSALKLKPIQLGPIRKGGYVISYDWVAPSGVTLWLGLPDLTNAMEVTGRDRNDLLSQANLPAFLSLIGKKKWWGTQGTCKLIAKRGTAVIAESNLVAFPCPVRPYVGRLTPALGRGDSGPALKYTGTPPKYPDGRVLFMPPIDGCYYFAYGGRFETDDSKRGFNCITYVGAVFGVDVNSGAMSGYGTQLVNHCGWENCGCENKTLPEVKAFFAATPTGTYFLWSEHHIVVVVNGSVHEFRERLGRYNVQPVSQWQHSDHRWWVRKARRQF